MRKRLFAFFILILFFGVTITGFVSYDFIKNQIVLSTKNNLRSESSIVDAYINLSVRGNKIDFETLAKDIKKKINKRVTIIRIDGVVAGESDLPKEKLENHLHRPEIQGALKTGEGSALRFSNTEKTPFFYFARRTSIDGKPYFVRLAIRLDAIRQVQAQYSKLVFFAVILGIIISSLLAYIYLDHFIKPINSLINMATTIANGQYEKRIYVTSKDEIGQLGNAFNSMAERLYDTINDLNDKRDKLISILTSMDDGVIVLDNNQRIILINPAAGKLFNIEEDSTGKNLIEAVRNSELQDIINNIPEENVEIGISHPQYRLLSVKATRVINHDHESESFGVLLVIQDVTKIKNLEQVRTDFVANVSHELKTPLTSIKGFAETLKYVEDRETKDKFLDIIYVESERLTRLINDILILSEIENRDNSLILHRINIIEVVEDVFHIMEPMAKGKQIQLNHSAAGDEIYVMGDTDKLKQMMINLIDNAIKYTNNGGKVNITLKSLRDEVMIKVADTGIGIPEEHINRLYERFYRVDKARSRSLGGTGLGLAIVKHIVMMLSGKIDVKSKIGEGTVFTIILPRAK